MQVVADAWAKNNVKTSRRKFGISCACVAVVAGCGIFGLASSGVMMWMFNVMGWNEEPPAEAIVSEIATGLALSVAEGVALEATIKKGKALKMQFDKAKQELKFLETDGVDSIELAPSNSANEGAVLSEIKKPNDERDTCWPD